MRALTPAVVACLLAAGCAPATAGSPPPSPPGATEARRAPAGEDAPIPVHETTRATLWVQTSAEWRALALQAFDGATRALHRALADSTVTAALEQEGLLYRELPPAVILDVDETVLDNSPFQARLIALDSDYDPELWAAWTAEATAEAVPGALAFTREAAARGVRVFYVTNRDAAEEAATRRNLERLGFPLGGDEDVILTRGEQEGWGGDKASRRRFLSERYRILAVVGDDLNDFVSGVRGGVRARAEVARGHRARWGREWFLLPNPVYGSWERALYAGEEVGSEVEKRRIQGRWLRAGPPP